MTFNATQVSGEEKLSKDQLAFFETKIRPVLVENCYACHSEKANENQGGLLLDSREGMRRGGDSGPAVVPENLSASLLIAAIRYSSDDLQMPPEDNGGKLPAHVIRDFETWVRMGAPDPRDGPAKIVSSYDTSDANSWWSFQPIKRVMPSSMSVASPHEAWPRTDIDKFIAAKWESNGLTPVGDAEPTVLLRRLRFDLTGLPPSQKEMADFLSQWQKAPAARQELLENTVDRLLDSREFAERWGRHWLDVARYAESSGKDVNLVYPHAWRYRDYVIDAFDKDKPFDVFLREQIAGDLLPAKNESERAEHLIATAFLALGENPINERNAKQFAVDLADDQIAVVSQAFLGQTVACARCHDHRFDPITQRDYTALAGIFLSTETKYGTAGAVGGRNRAGLIELPAGANLPVVGNGMSSAETSGKQRKLERLKEQQRSARAQRANGGRATDRLTDFDIVRINTQISQLEFELSIINEDGSAKALAMGVADRPVSLPEIRRPGRPERPRSPQNGRPMRPGQRMPPNRQMRPGQPMQAGANREQMQQRGRNQASGFEQIGDSPLFLRGNIENEGQEVPRGIPALLGSGEDILIRRGSGRLQLAEALVSPDNTLTSRVIVNRTWHWLFGRGIVASVDNFGTSGAEPSHPELLDYLADRFVQNGWSMKDLIREITLSRVYQLSSSYDAVNFAADPDNSYLWRHTSRRLEAEELRDAILSAAGRLDLSPEPASLIGRAGDGPIGGLRFQAVTLDEIGGADHQFRSIYLPATRSVQPAVLADFDPPDSSATDGAREATNVPSQALFMLNSEFVAQQSQHLADTALRKYPGRSVSSSVPQRLEFVFQSILNRAPTEHETQAARRLLGEFDTPRQAWTSIVRSLFASAEFRFID
ncbi:PSD1 and planctomycete cytochrome C domain-containing protein [Bremerella cremea]|nr:PSD1 and planctomycete cytochrome C domain-containing protein [Bremerella cremea]